MTGIVGEPDPTPFNSVIAQDQSSELVRSIDHETMLVENSFAGRHIFHLFGRNNDVDAAEDIWPGGGDYTGFPTGAADTFTTVSSSAADAAAGTGARTWRWFYLDENFQGFDANGIPLFFDVTLNGLTPVTSVVTGKRLYGGYCVSAGSGLTNAGNITVYHTAAPAEIFAVARAGVGQAEMAVMTIPLGYTGFIRRYSASMYDNTANSAAIAIKVITPARVQILLRSFHISTTSGYDSRPYSGFYFSEMDDVVMRALSVLNANADIDASFDIELVKN